MNVDSMSPPVPIISSDLPDGSSLASRNPTRDSISARQRPRPKVSNAAKFTADAKRELNKENASALKLEICKFFDGRDTEIDRPGRGTTLYRRTPFPERIHCTEALDSRNSGNPRILYHMRNNTFPVLILATRAFPMADDLPDDLPVQIAGQCRSRNRHSHLPVMHSGTATCRSHIPNAGRSTG
jgi:hypothetical protein